MRARTSRLAFALLTGSLVLGAAALMGKLVVFYKPWRTTEVALLGVVAGIAAFAIGWYVQRRRPLRLAWLGIVAIGWLGVGVAYVLSFEMHHRQNVRPVADYVTAADIPGASSESLRRDDGAELARYFADRPRVSLEHLPRVRLPWREPSELADRARDLMASRYKYLSRPAVDLPEDLTWEEDPFDDHSWRWEHNAMGPTGDLTRAYVQTGELRYLQRAETLILDWIDDNSGYVFDPPTEYVWNDHATAIRLATWLIFWVEWEKSSLFTTEKMNRVLGSMLAHAERLTRSDFYTENHNHGIDQDRALLSFTLVFPELSVSEDWRRLALRRLEGQLTATISPNGVHLEHSPGYHFRIMERIHEIDRVFGHFDLQPQFPIDLRELQSRMARFASTTIRPDGRIVPIGDSDVTPDSNISKLPPPAVPWMEYPLTAGRSGVLHDTVTAYPEEGYAVIRDFEGGALPYERSLYLFFTVAAHEVTGIDAHKHADDLSFVLSYDGRDLVREAGLYGYNRDRKRDFVLSSRAHNVVLVDGEDFSGFESRFERFTTSPSHTTIVASHGNYPTIHHRRWLIYLPPTRIVVVDDLVPSDRGSSGSNREEHLFQQLFNLADDLRVTVDRDAASVTAAPPSESECPRLRLTQLHGDVETRVVEGRDDPMLGWWAPTSKTLRPSPVAVFSARGTDALYVTALDLSRCGSGALDGASTAPTVQLRGEDGLLIAWDEAGRGRRIEIDRATGDVQVIRN